MALEILSHDLLRSRPKDWRVEVFNRECELVLSTGYDFSTQAEVVRYAEPFHPHHFVYAYRRSVERN